MMMPPPLPPHSYPRINNSMINNSINTSSLNNSSMNSLQLSTLMANVLAPEEEDNAQSILEEHCSRIWDGSNDQTPSRSPPGGRHSPKSWSPDRSGSYSRRAPGGPGPTPNTSGISLFSGARGHHKSDRRSHKADNVSVGSHFLSNKSFDSGMGEDRSGLHSHHHGDGLDSQRHKHVHHYHHHHHAGGKDVRKQMDYEAQKEAQRRMQYHRSDSNILRGHPEPLPGGPSLDMLDSRGRSRDTRKTSAKKTSDSSSNIDSGVSLHYDISPHQVPNVNDPSNEK